MQTILKRPRYQVALHPGGKAMFIIIMGEKTTDGAPGLEPLQRLPIRDGNGEVNYYEEANDSLERLWRQKLGRYLYKHVVMNELREEGLLGVSSRRFRLPTAPLCTCFLVNRHRVSGQSLPSCSTPTLLIVGPQER